MRIEFLEPDHPLAGAPGIEHDVAEARQPRPLRLEADKLPDEAMYRRCFHKWRLVAFPLGDRIREDVQGRIVGSTPRTVHVHVGYVDGCDMAYAIAGADHRERVREFLTAEHLKTHKPPELRNVVTTFGGRRRTVYATGRYQDGTQRVWTRDGVRVPFHDERTLVLTEIGHPPAGSWDLQLDQGWYGRSGGRCITDFTRHLTFARGLDRDELAAMCTWLRENKCPGWTGVHGRHVGTVDLPPIDGARRAVKGAQVYRFTTTYDSSD